MSHIKNVDDIVDYKGYTYDTHLQVWKTCTVIIFRYAIFTFLHKLYTLYSNLCH